ncbi:MAG: ribosome maturation factor RimP [Candidatus Acidiferrales bacterium]
MPFRKTMDLQKIREAAERVARSEGVEVVDVEWKVGRERFLRVSIDRPWQPVEAGDTLLTGQGHQQPAAQGGISHRECEAVSQQLSVILDVEDLIPGAARYTLEVSSPGLDRKLAKPEDFERFAGRLARITLNEPVENQKFFEGRLAGYADGAVQVALKDRMVALPLELIRKAHLVVEF